MQAAQQRQCEIGFEMPLVKLVQHNGIDAREQRVGNQTPRENAFRQETETGSRTGYFFKANLITNGLAERFAKFLSYPARGQAHGQTPRLEHQHVSANQIEQRRRNSRGFPRARRGFDD